MDNIITVINVFKCKMVEKLWNNLGKEHLLSFGGAKDVNQELSRSIK